MFGNQSGYFSIYFKRKKNCIEVLNIPEPMANKRQKIYKQIKNIVKNTPEKIYD